MNDKPNFVESKVFRIDSYPSEGCLSLDRNIQWYSCREQFQPFFLENAEGILYCFSPDQTAHFLNKAENIIAFGRKRINPKDNFEFSTYAMTNIAKTIWIQPSKFWMSCPVKRSFLTALLRCSNAYDVKSDNFDKSLWSKPYTSSTQLATKRFLFGYTKCTLQVFNNSGWQSLFHTTNATKIRKDLVAEETSIPNNHLKEYIFT